MKTVRLSASQMNALRFFVDQERRGMANVECTSSSRYFRGYEAGRPGGDYPWANVPPGIWLFLTRNNLVEKREHRPDQQHLRHVVVYGVTKHGCEVFERGKL